MNRNILFIACLAALSVIPVHAEDALRKPNVIYILADDLGYGEVGYNGQEMIQTPELDALAEGGMTFSAH